MTSSFRIIITIIQLYVFFHVKRTWGEEKGRQNMRMERKWIGKHYYYIPNTIFNLLLLPFGSLSFLPFHLCVEHKKKFCFLLSSHVCRFDNDMEGKNHEIIIFVSIANNTRRGKKRVENKKGNFPYPE